MIYFDVVGKSGSSRRKEKLSKLLIFAVEFFIFQGTVRNRLFVRQ